MKLYTSIGPNPRVVAMFLAEKGVEIPRVEIDILKGENREPDHLARNPAGQSPVLALDDGTHLAEVTAICEYLEELYPSSPLIGTTPEERAVTRMWTRRIDLHIAEPMLNGFRASEGRRLFEGRMRLFPQAANDLKALAQERLTWLDGLMAGRDFVAGDRLSLADILLFCVLDFGITVRQPLNGENRNVAAWFERMKGRESAVETGR